MHNFIDGHVSSLPIGGVVSFAGGLRHWHRENPVTPTLATLIGQPGRRKVRDVSEDYSRDIRKVAH